MARPTVWLIEEPPAPTGPLRRALEKNDVAGQATIAMDSGAALLDARLGSAPNVILLAFQDAAAEEGFLGQLRQSLHSAPPIVSIHSDGAASPASLRRAGASSVVALPASPKQMNEAVLDLLIYWLLLEAEGPGSA